MQKKKEWKKIIFQKNDFSRGCFLLCKIFYCNPYIFILIWKMRILKLKILLNFLLNLWKKLGFSIFLFENFIVSSSTIVLCIPLVRPLQIGFLTLRKNNGVKSEFLNQNCKTGLYRFEMKTARKSHQYLWQKLWLCIGIV